MLSLRYTLRQTFCTSRALLLMLTYLLWAALLPAASAQAAPLSQAVITVELFATQDARIQGGSPDNGFGSGLIWVGTPNGHLGLVEFDVTLLPVNATIDSAELQLNFTGVYTPTAHVELGRNDAAWDEATITWNTKPANTFGGPTQTIGDAPGPISWDAKSTVEQWVSGALPNYGFALRGDGPLKSFHSKETSASLMPKLVITYRQPEDDGEPRPDLGDAPDSTNHHGINNTAYAGAGVLGQFPTVYDVPAGQVAGPRHDNVTGEGILGQFLSREREADLGPDQDGLNNILRNSITGAVGDVADNDRGDDGWRNRNIRFFDCRKQTLTVRIAKAPAATLNKMYLNVWFDGNRDGDWADINPCQPPAGGPAEASYEWIVQDHIIDMTAIPAGGFLDFNIDTERVFNSTTGLPHWMRFTLSEARAVQPQSGGYPDGRGPHPNSAQGSFKFGETEDIFQKPPLAGEDGELMIEKRVITSEDPVDYAGMVTYEIRLRQNGGSQPIEAQIRDELDSPLHLLRRIDSNGNISMIDVTSPTGGASPLQGQLDYNYSDPTAPINQIVSWEGTLEPDAEIRLSFDVHVHPLCERTQQTQQITNVAQARQSHGDPITAEASFTAKCPGYDAQGGIQIDPEPIDHPIDVGDWTTIPWRGNVHNNHHVPVTLAFFQQPTGSRASISAAVAQENREPNKNGHVDASHDLRFLQRVTLEPNEQRRLDLTLRMAQDISDELSLPDDYSPIGKILFCILPGEEEQCANAEAYPNMVGEVAQPEFVPGPDDLGDAPDSTNHFGAAMAAYPGVQANFPTVFDPAAGLPQGPKHRHPGQLHLGPAVSREAEADIGPDGDGVHNITPPANTANQDWFDDGSRLSNLSNCQPARADVQVSITPQIANLFAQLEQKAYLNIWLDMNADGDWEDGVTCVDEAGQNKEAVEHILIDYPIDVAGLGAGLHPIQNIMTREVVWPAALAQNPRWVRFTLSERASNKPLTFGGIQYGDGRGYARPFKVGETEDHLRTFNDQAQNGPDMAVRLDGQIAQRTTQQVPAAAVAASTTDRQEVRLKIDYANLGTQTAQGATLTLRKSDTLRDLEVQLLTGPGLQPGDFTDSADALNIALPDLEPNQNSSIVLSFGLLSPAQATAAMLAEFTASVQIVLAGDIDPSNNQASVTLTTPHAPLRLAASVESDDLRRKADTTCRDQVTLQGVGEAMQMVDFYVNDASNMQLQVDPNGRLEDVRLTNLQNGRNQIWIDYAGGILSPRDADSGRAVRLMVDTDLPVDPITLLLTNSQGRQYHPPTLGWARGAPQVDSWHLQDGETYVISIHACVDDPNLSARLLLNNDLLGTLHDHDGDGSFTGSFTYHAPVQAAQVNAVSQMRLVVQTGGAEQSFAAEISPQTQGVVRDAATNLPLADASVAALVANGSTDFSALSATESSAPDAQTTGTDGSFSFAVANGTYRLDVVRSGYQPYRSGNIVVTDGALAADIGLTPAIADVANHLVYLTANGFEPAVVNAKPGDVVMWINADLDAHAVTGGSWDSGLLLMGDSHKARLADTGTFDYVDGQNALLAGKIIVAEVVETPGGSNGSQPVFLPLIRR